ncbi:Crp/Fnr family transcriptional regulator [Alteromonas sp. A081]|uniref:Crp/Fnr family transcriptional regulator n=1 Tax=Alteromonas sp. A081 TaxID=3410269 RepID=UPI003B981DF7
MMIDRCTQITLENGEQLNTADMPIEKVYFPITSFTSFKTKVIDDKSIEIGLIGCEGMLGASVVLGNKNALMTTTVRHSGSALCMETDLFEDLVNRNSQIRKLVLNYLYVLMQQFGQRCACNRFHMVKQRLAHWLLITQDRTPSKHLILTHDFLAQLLGVRRSAVTIAAGLIMQQGTISYSRGNIVVLSRKALELTSCGCYRNSINVYNKTMVHFF